MLTRFFALIFLDRPVGQTYVKLFGYLQFCADFSQWPTVIITPDMIIKVCMPAQITLTTVVGYLLISNGDITFM